MVGDSQAKYRPYPAYKPSGVQWLGDIPEGWEVKKLKYVCTHNDDVLSETVQKDWELEYVDIGSVSAEDGITITQTMPFQRAPSRARRIVRNGDILISTVRTYLKAIAPIIDPPENMVASTGFAVIRPTLEFQSKFASFALRLEGYINEIVARSVGVSYPAINASDLVDICVPLPPIPEQTKIATFLDHETAKIDALIAKQQRLIALLEEKRQAVISHAVTKGLDPTTPLRPSGIDWLGDVPEHWEVKHGKHLFEFVTSGSRGWAEYYSDDGALFFRITNLTRDTIRPKLKSLQYVTPPRGSEGERSKIALGDLLISITADLGSVCVADENLEGGYVSQHVALCRPNGEVFSADWFGYTILSDASKFQLLESGYGGTKVQLSLPDLKELIVAKPPEFEQVQIADFLDRKLKHFADILDRSTDQITLLKERRTALISAAVTGKIDLRDWQPPEGTQAHSTQDIDQNEEALA
jgi:type I restriction enzyme S subunit